MSKKTAFIIAGLFLLTIVVFAVMGGSATQDSQLAAVAQTVGTQSAAPLASASTAALQGEISALSAQILKTPALSTATDPRVALAQRRAALMQQLAQSDPQAFLLHVIPDSQRAKLPTAVQTYIERKVKLKGKIEVLHIDDFTNHKNSRFEYHLRVGTVRYALYLAGSSPAMLSGSTVQVNGYQTGQTLVAVGNTGGLTVTAAASPTPDSVGVQNTLAILIANPGQPLLSTKDQLYNYIFNDKFQKFYQEQSYGKVSFTGEVTDWISASQSYVICGQPFPTLDSPEIKSYLLSHSINLSLYGRVVYVINGITGGCAVLGKYDVTFNGAPYYLSEGWVGYDNSAWDKSYMNGFEYVLSHEMGHELGVMHANSWVCTGPSLDVNCSHLEYGNSFDVMDRGGYSAHFNAFYKDLLGWLGSSDKVQITKSGTFVLTPLESTSGYRAGIINNPALIAINPNAQPTYLEYRKPIGFDSGIPVSGVGIHINQVIAPVYQFPFPRILNANYASYSSGQWQWVENFPLLPGSSFTWSGQGIAINNLSTSPTSATFNATLSQPTCNLSNPSVQFSGPYMPPLPDSNTTYWFSMTNNDTLACHNRSFTFTASVTDSAGWLISLYPTDPILLTAGESTQGGAVYLYMPGNVTIGTHTLTLTAIDTARGTLYTYTYPVVVTNGIPTVPVIRSVVPSKASVGANVTITGSGFDPSNNQISIILNNSNYYGTIQNVAPSPDGTLKFTVPATLIDNGGKGAPGTVAAPGDTVPTLPGSYILYVTRMSDYYSSALVPFEVIDYRLTATPNPVIIPYGQQSGTTTLSWYIPTSTTAQLWVSAPGFADARMSCAGGPQLMQSVATLITTAGDIFNIYQTPTCNESEVAGKTPDAVLSVTATIAPPPPGPTITASPNPCTLKKYGKCSSTISWTTSSTTQTVQVWRLNLGSASSTRFSCTTGAGSKSATGITTSGSTFSLYPTTNCALNPINKGIPEAVHVRVKGASTTASVATESQFAAALHGIQSALLTMLHEFFGRQ